MISTTLLIGMLRFYRRVVSPWLGKACRFEPSCSCYAIEAIQKRGALRGSLDSVWRILRCQPFAKGGFDPA